LGKQYPDSGYYELDEIKIYTQLTGSMRKTAISNLFSGSGSFHSVDKNAFNVLLVDEAHRLNAKSGMFKNIGENQVKEIIDAASLSVFFIDEDQKVTFSDIGSKEEIIKWAAKVNAKVRYHALESKFRCNGSDGYLAWLDHLLEIKETANTTLNELDCDFKIISNLNELRELIVEKNKINNKARMVAGYCWNWVSKNNSEQYDIVIDDFNPRS
jgi:hypothetical protein